MSDVRSAMGAYDETRLYEELERLTTEACAEARDGDPDRLVMLVEQRQVFVELIHRADVAVDGAAVERILSLDRELLARVSARQAHLRDDLARLAWARESLAAYAAAPPRGPAYVERTG